MKGLRLTILSILSVLMMVVFMGGSCGGGDDVETPTVGEMEPDTGNDTAVEEPVVPPEEDIVTLTDADFRIAYFDYDKYNLRGDAREALEHNARVLRENTGVRVLIEGHCDERGTVEYNLALGEKRANSARDYITSLGVDGSRVETISYGKERPVRMGHDDQSWQENRRAKFTIISQ